MNTGEIDNIFHRYEGNPILTREQWPYLVESVFNPGAVRFNNTVLLLVRVEDRQGYSHLTKVVSQDGKTDWQIDPKPTLRPDESIGEAIFGLEDPRIVWIEERQEYVITYVSFCSGVAGEPPCISLMTTKDFSEFKHIGRQLLPPNKDASLFSKTFNGCFALINRPVIEGRADIWVSFSPNLKHWGEDKVLLPVRHRSWDANRVGLGPPPIETPEGWLIIYHGARDTASGPLYRTGLALLDLETLQVIRRSREWIFGPQEPYEKIGDVGDVVFPCGTVIDKNTNEILVYYGAADSVVGLTIANLDDILTYLRSCPES